MHPAKYVSVCLNSDSMQSQSSTTYILALSEKMYGGEADEEEYNNVVDRGSRPGALES